ncbi:hypothetical protein BgAZ_300870 [Babesia gibsoni]|uniref:BRCT domain-containing protein n=1 Tax=Babesia gibsoni TaxID=33632 RepID=A0AAD8LKM6_BABGI|nr:hypothetical protein BgAZ_300870 [Babesia gibsoni]
MADKVEEVYRVVYERLGVYKNNGKGLYMNRTFCLVGFEHEVDSGKELIKYMITTLISRGASLFKYPNKNLEKNTLTAADYFVCNYGLGLSALTYDILETKLVTPIWLYVCNRDCVVYDTQLLPIFTAAKSFRPLMFSQEEITVLIVNELDSRSIKDSADILTRFARHCGFKIENAGAIRSGRPHFYMKSCRPDAPPQGKTYFLIAQSMDKKFDAHILAYIHKYKVPCVAIQWLLDCYASGELEDVKKYLVDAQFEATTVTTTKKRRISPIDGTIAACIQHKRTVCLSYAAALDCSEEVRRMIRGGDVKIHVVNPIHLLAPWTMDIVSTRDRSLYNNLSLVDESRILLYVSAQEAAEGALGIFAQISMLMDDFQYRHIKRHKGVRNIEIHHIQDIYLKNFPGPYTAISVPQELIAGDSLVPRGHTRTFNLYDLADSIAFMGDDNIMEDEEIHDQQTHIRHRWVINIT